MACTDYDMYEDIIHCVGEKNLPGVDDFILMVRRGDITSWPGKAPVYGSKTETVSVTTEEENVVFARAKDASSYLTVEISAGRAKVTEGVQIENVEVKNPTDSSTKYYIGDENGHPLEGLSIQTDEGVDITPHTEGEGSSTREYITPDQFVGSTWIVKILSRTTTPYIRVAALVTKTYKRTIPEYKGEGTWMYSGDITLANGVVWKKVSLIPDNSSFTCEQQGTYGCKTYHNSINALIPGAAAEAAGLCAQLNNDDVVFLIHDRNGNYRVFGNPYDIVSVNPKQESGASWTDSQQTTLEISVNEQTPAPFYDGAIVTSEGQIQ